MKDEVFHFRLAQFQFVLIATDWIHLPVYKGSGLWGAFG